MKNRLSDLNDHLFEQIERLRDCDATSEDVEREARRTQSIVALADQIVGTADLQLKAARLFAEHGKAILPMLPRIGGKSSAPQHDERTPAIEDNGGTA